MFKLTPKEKQMIIAMRKRHKAEASPQQVLAVLTKLLDYFHKGVIRLGRLESILNRLRRYSKDNTYLTDSLAKIEDHLNIAMEEMETLRNNLTES